MDVHEVGKGEFLVAGQVILSCPGVPVLRCCGLITDERLEREAEQYGAAGGRPQVVWPNGVLASTAVGLLTQVVTPWYSKAPEFIYLDYDGNKGTVTREPEGGVAQGITPARIIPRTKPVTRCSTSASTSCVSPQQAVCGVT